VESRTWGLVSPRLRLALIIAAVLVAMRGLSPCPAAHAGSVEAAVPPVLAAGCQGPREASASGPGTYRFAQSFVPQLSGALTSAEVDVTKAPESSGDWIVQIFVLRPIPIGNPSHDVVAQATIPDSTVPNGQSTIATKFADPATVLAGGLPRREYQLVITRPGSSDLTVGYRRGNDCGGELFQSSSQTGPFGPYMGASNDLVFKVFVSDVVPPQTRFTKRPKKKTRRHRARFRWRSNEPVDGYECRLDKAPFESCDPPERVKVKPGRHRFRVRAIDRAGNVDPKPAKFRWKVLR
jgi:hypothetical protein